MRAGRTPRPVCGGVGAGPRGPRTKTKRRDTINAERPSLPAVQARRARHSLGRRPTPQISHPAMASRRMSHQR